MSGIAGFSGANSADIVKKMSDLMAYRGPSASGMTTLDGFSLAQRSHLSDGKDAAGRPTVSQSGRIVLVCDGEIYNSPALRDELRAKGHSFQTNASGEVILKLYEDEGEAFVKRLRGAFGLAIWDADKKRLLLARDHMGQKPVFYAMRDGAVAFASEPKAVLASGLLTREIDLEALWHYMSLRYLPDDRSLFKNCIKLPAATYVVFEKGKVRTETYWHLDTFKQKRQGTVEELTDELEQVLLESVKMHMLSDVPVGTFLSGGIDSSLITAMMAKITGKPFDTFSIGVKEQDINELPWAKIIADQYHLNWCKEIVQADIIHTIPDMIYHMDEPADPFGVGVYLVSQVASKHAKVVLSGDGGDENFAGYDRFAGQAVARKYALLPGFLRKGVFRPIIHMIPESFGYKSIATKLRWLDDIASHSSTDGEAYARSMCVLRFTQETKEALFTDKAKGQIADSDSVAKILSWYNDGTAEEHLDKMLYTDLQTRMPDQLLSISDRMSMAHSIEIRPPMGDYKVTEFAASLPCNLKLKGRNRGLKWLLRQVASRYMPQELIDRKKQGFGFPIARWLRGDLANFQRNLFKQSRFVEQGLFRQSVIDKLVDEHLSGKADHNFRLWMLINLEIWHRMCIEGKTAGEMKEFIDSLR